MSEKGKDKKGRYYYSYPLNIYETPMERATWDAFNKIIEETFQNKRIALLQAIKMYVDYYEDMQGK